MSSPPSCVSEFGNPDAIGIGIRIGTYLLTLPILTSYIFFRTRDNQETERQLWNALQAQVLSTVVVHFTTWIYLIMGRLDLYTMLVLAQASCLMSGPQLIHLFRYGRHSLHRRIYSLNTLATSIEIFILMFFCRVPGRNLGLCPDLGLAMVEFSRNRLAFLQTLPSWLLAISLLLSLLDWFINWRDTHVNKGRRENNKHTIPFRPRKMTWELKANQTQRYIWGFLGTMLYAVTIFSIESRTIHAFEHFIAGKDGVSLTSEEQWNFGQMFAISIGITSAALLIRAGLLEILFPWAKKAASIRNGTYSCLDIELRRIECFSKIFFLLAPLTKVRGKGRKPTRGSSCRSQPLDHEETINTAGASPDMPPVPTLPHRLATTHPELTLSPPSKSQEISD